MNNLPRSFRRQQIANSFADPLRRVVHQPSMRFAAHRRRSTRRRIKRIWGVSPIASDAVSRRFEIIHGYRQMAATRSLLAASSTMSIPVCCKKSFDSLRLPIKKRRHVSVPPPLVLEVRGRIRTDRGSSPCPTRRRSPAGTSLCRRSRRTPQRSHAARSSSRTRDPPALPST